MTDCDFLIFFKDCRKMNINVEFSRDRTFLAKNQYPMRKLLYFVNSHSGKSLKIERHFIKVGVSKIEVRYQKTPFTKNVLLD